MTSRTHLSSHRSLTGPGTDPPGVVAGPIDEHVDRQAQRTRASRSETATVTASRSPATVPTPSDHGCRAFPEVRGSRRCRTRTYAASASSKHAYASSSKSTNRTSAIGGSTASRTVRTAIRAPSWPAVDARRDRRKGDRPGSEFRRHPQRLPVAGGQQRGTVLRARPDRAHRVDDVLRVQPAGCRRHSLAGRQPLPVARGPQGPAGGEDLGPATPVNRTVHPTTTQKRGVGGVDQDVGVLLGDVPTDEVDRRMCRHATILPPGGRARGAVVVAEPAGAAVRAAAHPAGRALCRGEDCAGLG